MIFVMEGFPPHRLYTTESTTPKVLNRPVSNGVGSETMRQRLRAQMITSWLLNTPARQTVEVEIRIVEFIPDLTTRI
jgi:hypothetical protein